MRRFGLILLALVWWADQSSADFIRYYPPSGSGTTFTGGTITSAVEGVTGCTAPSYSFTDDTSAGLCLVAANSFQVQTAGSGNSRSYLSGTTLGMGLNYVNAAGVATALAMTETSLIWTLSAANYFSLNEANGAVFGRSTADDQLIIKPVTDGAGAFAGTFTSADLTAARTWTYPDVSGTPQINLVAGTAAPGATECDAALEVGRLYHQTGDPATVQSQLFRCTQTGAAGWGWMPAGYQRGTAPPSTCTAGNTFFDTDATAGSNWFGCTSADTWTLLGGAMGDPGANGIMVRTAANTSVNRTITAGAGLICSNGDGVSGNPTCSVDPATTPQTAVGTGVDTAWYSTKALTESAATSITQVSVASGAATGGEAKFSVVATDATDHQSVRGTIDFACANKAGTESCTISASDVTLTTSGTLVCAYTVSTTPANAIDLQLNCVSSLTQSSLNAYHVTTLYGPGTVTPQ
jgi:hypothetical protein